jgi:predicted nucleic acid-binding protein
MILTDSGILIQFMRTKDAKLGRSLQTLPVAICGAVRAELLAGTRNAVERASTKAFLQQFHYLPFEEDWWERLGDNLAVLYANGLSVPFPDAVIATVAIENDLEVWAVDPHFPVMQKFLPRLRLYQPPP